MPERSSKRSDRYGTGGRGPTKDKFAWGDMSDPAIGEMVAAVLSIGDACLFGVTRDGSAVRLILMSGDDRESEYFGDAESLLDFARHVASHIRENHS
jgi:hypothetical protein